VAVDWTTATATEGGQFGAALAWVPDLGLAIGAPGAPATAEPLGNVIVVPDDGARPATLRALGTLGVSDSRARRQCQVKA